MKDEGGSGAGPLARFLQRLQDERQIADAKARFQELVQGDTALSPEHKALLLRGDAHEIRHALASEYADLHGAILFFISSDPDDD